MAGRSDDRTAPAADRGILITRIFDAPRKLVFEAWTKPEHLLRWWLRGLHDARLQGRPAPRWPLPLLHANAEGPRHLGLRVYREIVVPERIVYLDSFADARGNPVAPSHYGMSDGHPGGDAGDRDVHGTRRQDEAHAAARHPALAKNAGGTEQGWGQMLDRLAEELARSRT